MKLKVYFGNNQNKEKAGFVLKRTLRRAAQKTLKFEKMKGKYELSVTFTDDEGIKELNREHRGRDKPTDVLSFPMYEAGELPENLPEIALGDIVISLERAREQSAAYGHSYKREVAFLTIHSMLHLLGYDHEKSEKEELEMRAKQTAIANAAGFKVKENEKEQDK